jgi:thioredoxin 1
VGNGAFILKFAIQNYSFILNFCIGWLFYWGVFTHFDSFVMSYNSIINSATVVMVEFYASWCPHCRHMMPIVAEVKQQLDGQISVAQLDIDANEAMAAEAGVESVPTFIIYVDGNEVWRDSGEMPGDVLLAKAKSYLQ